MKKDAVKTELLIIAGISLFGVLLHLYTNLFASYGYFRDEFYYIACSNHPAAGYVDQPPLSIYILSVSRLLFGDSLFALRLLPALMSGIVVYLTGLITLEMGGKKTSVIIACLSAALAPIFLAMNTFYSMNSFDWVFWAVSYYIIIRIIRAGEAEQGRLWMILGAVLGLGLLNKIGILWLGFGILAGLLLTPHRKLLKTIWPYAAGLIALIIFLPFIIWNFQNNFAHLEFIKNATLYKYSSLNPLDFIAGQFLNMNPLAAPVWLAGIYFLFFNKAGEKFKILGIIFVSAFLILIINGHSKAEYLGPAYPALFAAGGVYLERISSRRFFKWLKIGMPSLILAGGILIAPLALPILPVDQFISYYKFLGVSHQNSEHKKLAQLPQFYADMFGWENMAATVSKFYTALPDSEKNSCEVYTGNYGEAGALQFYSKKYPLPPVISGHNNYWLWGYGNKEPRVMIVLGGDKEEHEALFKNVFKAGEIKDKYAMPYENNLPVFICSGYKMPLKNVWSRTKHYE